jgi:hypothetical protein
MAVTVGKRKKVKEFPNLAQNAKQKAVTDSPRRIISMTVKVNNDFL